MYLYICVCVNLSELSLILFIMSLRCGDLILTVADAVKPSSSTGCGHTVQQLQKKNQQQLHCHCQQGFPLRLFTHIPLRKISRPQTPEVRQPASFSRSDFYRPLTSHKSTHPIICPPLLPPAQRSPVTQTCRRPRASHTDRGLLSFPPVVPRPVRIVHYVPDSKRRKHLNLLAAVVVAGEGGVWGCGSKNRNAALDSVWTRPQTTIWRFISCSLHRKNLLSSALVAA